MRFAPSHEHRQFAESLDQLLTESDTPGVVRAWAAGDHQAGLALWRQLAEVGVTGLLVPEQHGGMAAEPVDLAIACERLGYHAVPGPVVESVAAVPVLLSDLGEEGEIGGQKVRDHLVGLSSGGLLATLTWPPHVPFALDADVAGLALQVNGTEIRRVSSIGTEPMRSIDSARRLFAVDEHPVYDHGADEHAGDVSAGQGRVDREKTERERGSEAKGREVLVGDAVMSRAFDVAALACAAQLLGLGNWLLETATEHAKRREQYGREIGRFQAIKHRLADVAAELELARPLVRGAAVSLGKSQVSHSSPELQDSALPAMRGDSAQLSPPPPVGTARAECVQRDVSAAKVAAADAAYAAARAGLQVHGAVGYTAEHDLGLWLTKVRALVAAWGPRAHHRDRVAAALEECA